MLKMLNYLLMDETERQLAAEPYVRVKLCLARVIEEDSDIPLLVQILINLLVELGSNFIIQKNMERLLEYGERIRGAEFYPTYVNRVKQLIFNSTDEMKCLYLEYLLLYGEEYSGDKHISLDSISQWSRGKRTNV